jgi:general secretion pathway protein A
MYLRFYGLREEPFELTPNPRFLFRTSQHAEAIANLQYGLSTAKAVTVLTGEAGTGKTTVLRTALDSEACRHVNAIHLTNPQLSRAEFIETLARSFSLSPAAHTSKAALLAELEATVKAARQRGQISALIVDEAQRLSEELLEEVRLLANIETDTEKLLPLILAGQPELSDRLDDIGVRQLKQRVALRCQILPFELADTAAYIATRIRIAGGDARRLFTREAVMLIQEFSKGIPRSINVICDNALLSGFAAGRQPVGRDIVEEVAHDFNLAPKSSASAQMTEPALSQPTEVAAAVTIVDAPKMDQSVTATHELGTPVLEADPDEESTKNSRRLSLFGRP